MLPLTWPAYRRPAAGRHCAGARDKDWDSMADVTRNCCPVTNELVASFVNCSNLLKSWEKTETCEGNASGAYGPKTAAITRIPAPYAATESHHFSDDTAL